MDGRTARLDNTFKIARTSGAVRDKYDTAIIMHTALVLIWNAIKQLMLYASSEYRGHTRVTTVYNVYRDSEDVGYIKQQLAYWSSAGC